MGRLRVWAEKYVPEGYFGMSDADRKAWRDTHNLADLGARTDAYLRGEHQQSPGYMGPPNPETGRIRDDLSALNRHGLVTTQSQPGHGEEREDDGTTWEQRAFVEGYADRATTERLRAAAARPCDDEQCETPGPAIEFRATPVSEMRRAWQRDPTRGTADAVTMRDGEPVTGVPHSWKRRDHNMTWWGGDGIGGGAWDALEASDHVVAVDNHWGDRPGFWSTLRGAVEPAREEEGQQR